MFLVLLTFRLFNGVMGLSCLLRYLVSLLRTSIPRTSYFWSVLSTCCSVTRARAFLSFGLVSFSGYLITLE